MAPKPCGPSGCWCSLIMAPICAPCGAQTSTGCNGWKRLCKNAAISTANLKNEPAPELNFCRTDKRVFFSHTYSHVSQTPSHTNSCHRGGCWFVFAWTLFYTPSTSTATEVLQDRTIALQYFHVVLKILKSVTNKETASRCSSGRLFSGYSGYW